MKHRPLIFLSAILLLVVAAFWFGNGRFAPAAAQESGSPWRSSAEAPPDTPRDSFSVPDRATANGSEALSAAADITSWRVIGSALRPRESDVSYSVSGNGSCSYVTAGDASTVWNVAPDLPQGAVIDTLRMYYDDTSGSNSSAWFTVYDLYGDIVDEWSVSSNTSAGKSFNDSAAINHTIDYATYAYLINWRPVVSGSTMQLCGFRVFYEPPPFGHLYLPSVYNSP